MIFGDDWFTKTMLINTISRTAQLRTQMVPTASSSDNLFEAVLNQMIMELEGHSLETPQVQTYDPNVVTAMKQNNHNQTISSNSKEGLRFQSIPTETINRVLDGKLTGMGEVFVRAGKRYNISPTLLVAVAQHESANGKSNAAMEKNNIAGMMGFQGLKSYASIEDSIMDMARNLSKNYLGIGLNSIAKIGAKYAPIGADNDPTGLNNHWVQGVTKFYEKLPVFKV